MALARRSTPINGFSAVPVPAGREVKVRPTTDKEIATHRAGLVEGRRNRKVRAAYDAAGGHPSRADSFAQQALSAGVEPRHALDMVRGTFMHADPGHLGTAAAGSGEKLPRTLGTPNIDEPHTPAVGVIPARRWEDLHPTEQQRALQRVKQHGSSPEQMHTDLRDRVLSAHERAGRNLHSTPYSSLFYEGPSAPHSKIEEGADELMQHPAFQRTGLTRDHARAIVAVANSDTSPNVKFQQGDRYPNHEAAMHVVRHVLGGGHPDTPPSPGEMGIAAYPANLKKAAHHVSQMLQGRPTSELENPPAPSTGIRSKGFDPTSAPKTTDYVSAWIDPKGPDSRYVSDVHSTHSVMPHLDTRKPIMHRTPDGETHYVVPGDRVPKGAVPQYGPKHPDTGKARVKTGKSQVESYLAGDKVGLSALHDHVARNVAHELGLSHDPRNAGATHYVQATDWGEEQIARPDITDRTEAVAYGGSPRVHARGHDIEMRTPARGRIVTPPADHVAVTPARSLDDEERDWTIGDQKRHENTMAKRRREGRGPVITDEARAQGW